jgi:hypothetical protein
VLGKGFRGQCGFGSKKTVTVFRVAATDSQVREGGQSQYDINNNVERNMVAQAHQLQVRERRASGSESRDVFLQPTLEGHMASWYMYAEVRERGAILQARYLILRETSANKVHIERLHKGQDRYRRPIDEIHESPHSGV